MGVMDSQMFVVVTGPDGFPQRMETEDRIFMIPSLFTPHNPSRTKQRSAFPCSCCLCFSSLSLLLVFFDFCLFFYNLSFSAFWLMKFPLLKSRWPDDLKSSPPLKAKRLSKVLLSITCRQEKRVYLSLLPEFKKESAVCEVQLYIQCF